MATLIVTRQGRPRFGAGYPEHAAASWSAVAEMHGASLHRRHRFGRVMSLRWPQGAVQPSKQVTRQGLVACIGPLRLLICPLPSTRCASQTRAIAHAPALPPGPVAKWAMIRPNSICRCILHRLMRIGTPSDSTPPVDLGVAKATSAPTRSIDSRSNPRAFPNRSEPPFYPSGRRASADGTR